ncbi:MAG: hypothetical protein ACO3DS_05410 [Phycisphaerales bacterium]
MPRTPSTFRRVLWSIIGVVTGALVGAFANGVTLNAGTALIPPPAGVNHQNIESINASIAQYSAAQLMVPFAAHAVGALLGGAIAWAIARGRTAGMVSAIVVGALFLAGGVTMVVTLPNTPAWFAAMDLIGAYLPMAWLGTRIARLLLPSLA